MIQKMFLGFRAYLSGFQLLFSSPKYWGWALVPIIVTMGLGYLILSWGFQVLLPALMALLPDPTGWIWSILHTILQWTGWIVWILTTILGAYTILRIILVPFNAILAEKALIQLGSIQEEPFRLNIWLKKTTQLLLTSIFQTVFFVFLGGALFVLSFVPGLQVFAVFLGFLIIAFDCCDYSFELKLLKFRDKLLIFRRYFFELVGFSLGVGLTFMIPVLNVLFIPVAVLGGAQLVVWLQIDTRKVMTHDSHSNTLS